MADFVRPDLEAVKSPGVQLLTASLLARDANRLTNESIREQTKQAGTAGSGASEAPTQTPMADGRRDG
jgi:hypothetical protein